MPVFIRIRWAAYRLVRNLRRSILQAESEWELDANTRGRPILVAGPFRILIDPRAVRLFDAIHLYCDDVEVWLPILARLRLRSAVRLFLLRQAVENLPDDSTTAAKPKRSPKRARREQPA